MAAALSLTTGDNDRVQAILRRQAQMETARSTFDTLYQQVAERILPRENIFFRNGQIVQGEKRTEKIFDSAPELALGRCAAAIESIVTPRTQRYHMLAPMNRALKENRAVKIYCEQVNDVLFDARYAPAANFAGESGEHYTSLCAFGTGVTFLDEMLGSNLRYRCCHIAEVWFEENHQGVIDTVHRKFNYSARQAIKKFGERNVSPRIISANERNPDEEFEFIHCVQPREEIEYGRKDYKGMKFASWYMETAARHINSEGGYRTMPYLISRWITGPRETYGRSPAITILAGIKMLNEMKKTVIRAAHLATDPPKLMLEDGALRAFSMRPGANNFGGLSDTGVPLVVPFESKARIDIGLEMIQAEQRTINDAFLVTLFQILAEEPREMTATEVMERAQEKGQLLTPTMGRQETEYVGAMIPRELDILATAGQLPPMPDELIEAGGLVRIEHTSPLNRWQRSADAVGFSRTIEALTPVAAVNPKVMHIFNASKIGRGMADINGVPDSWMNSEEEEQAMNDQMDSAAQTQQLIDAAPAASGVIKDLTQAHSTALNTPQPQQAA